METKTLSKEEEKKESSEKILEIEEAYFNLMKAYSSCLTTLKLKKFKPPPFSFKSFSDRRLYMKKHMPSLNPRTWSTEYLLYWNILAPRIIRWRIGSQIAFLREVLLLLITQKRNKVDLKIIKQFELYCDDMDKLSVIFSKAGLIALLYGIVPFLPIILGILQKIPFEGILQEVTFEGIIFMIYTLYFIVIFFILGFLGSRRVLSEANVQEKEENFFLLIKNYLEFK